MKRRDIAPFGATSSRNPAYATPGGTHWILRSGGAWRLYQMGNKAEGRERKSLGLFPTLTAAVEHYRNEVAS